jgi:hypothetical protein
MLDFIVFFINAWLTISSVRFQDLKVHVPKELLVGALEIHFNDFQPSVLARNIIILKIVSASDFNPDNDEDFGFLWDVWYNMDWPEETRKRFPSVMKELTNEKLPDNVSIKKKSHLEKLKSLWSNWHSVSSKNKTDFESLLKILGTKESVLVGLVGYLTSRTFTRESTTKRC